MSADALAEGVTRAVLGELVSAIRAGTDEGAAIARAVEQLRAIEVHGPIAESVRARIAAIPLSSARPLAELATVSAALLDLERSVYTTTSQKPLLAIAREIVDAVK